MSTFLGNQEDRFSRFDALYIIHILSLALGKLYHNRLIIIRNIAYIVTPISEQLRSNIVTKTQDGNLLGTKPTY